MISLLDNMRMKKLPKLVAIYFLVTSGLLGCSSLPEQNQIIQDAKQASVDPNLKKLDVVKRAKSALLAAKKEELSLYSPQYFELAEKAFNKALANPFDPKLVKESSLTTIGYLNQAQKTKALVIKALNRSEESKERLILLDAQRKFPQQYQAVLSSLSHLSSLVELDEIDAAKSHEPDLLSVMNTLEIDSVSQTYLNKANNMLEQALILGAEALVPSTLLKTQRELKETKQLITQNPKDTARISEYSEKAMYSVERLFEITQTAKLFSIADSQQLEALLLSHEAQLAMIGKSLELENLGNISFDQQGKKIADLAQQTLIIAKGKMEGSQRHITQEELDRWRRTVVLLQTELRRLKRYNE